MFLYQTNPLFSSQGLLLEPDIELAGRLLLCRAAAWMELENLNSVCRDRKELEATDWNAEVSRGL